jgi:uncharacterized RDD family membrane protein YckC
MTYSSFGRRLGAYLIDFLLLSPLFALQIWASGHSISMAILSAVLVSVAFIGYRVYCHAIWGQSGIWYIASLITLFVNDQRRTLHDFIAGTVVAGAEAVPSVPTVAS